MFRKMKNNKKAKQDKKKKQNKTKKETTKKQKLRKAKLLKFIFNLKKFDSSNDFRGIIHLRSRGPM